MTDLIEKMARAAYDAEWGHGAFDSDRTSPFERETYRLQMRAALSALNLTPEQLSGLASGEMVVVPRGSLIVSPEDIEAVKIWRLRPTAEDNQIRRGAAMIAAKEG